VDAHIQRRQPLGHHPLQVGLGEAGQGGEVSVKEREPVVVVLQVQAGPQTGRELVDEAELAVVVARPHPVEQRRVHLGAQRLPSPLEHLELQHHPVAPHVDAQLGLVHQLLILDDVCGGAAVHAKKLVASSQAESLSY